MDVLAFIKWIFFSENAFQRKLDTQIDEGIATHNADFFAKSREVDFIIRRSRHEYGYALRPGQYRSITNFKKKHELTPWETSAALRTGVIKFQGKRSTIVLQYPHLGLGMFIAGLIGVIAAIFWYYYCRYHLVPSIAEMFDPRIVYGITRLIFTGLLLYVLGTALRFYYEAYSIRSRFRKRKIIK